MMEAQSELLVWSWGFLLVYIGGMLLFGYLGQRRVTTADDFATARGGYGPLFLAFAFSATTASGATFIGIPGIAYTTGLSAIWVLFLYPVGVYLGVWLCMKLVSRGGASFGSRSIPEYLGDRYQSGALRLLVAIFSLMLFSTLRASWCPAWCSSRLCLACHRHGRSQLLAACCSSM